MVVSAEAQADALLMQVLMSPDARPDPYPLYRQLRELAPVHRSGFGPVALSRYVDCMTALRDNRLGKATGDLSGIEVQGSQLRPVSNQTMAKFRARAGNSMLFANPPEHTRLRRLVSRAFTPSRVEALRPRVTAILGPLVDQLAGRPDVNLMDELAFPLPVTVIGELLGIPAEDRLDFQPLVRASVAALDPSSDEPTLQAAFAAQDEMSRYMAQLLAERRRQPKEDLLTGLVQARESDDRLTEEEIIATALVLFGAGFETTTNLIGNGLLALLRHPDQLAVLRADRSLIPQAVEELLRWDSPVQLDGRLVLEPAEVAGEELVPGQFVMMLIGGANRDPARFAEPETFDVRRPDAGPISFGTGIHHCLGAGLARLEGVEVFGQLLDRFSSIELAGEPIWRPHMVLRGLEQLPISVA
jgi:cytochrome P450